MKWNYIKERERVESMIKKMYNQIWNLFPFIKGSKRK